MSGARIEQRRTGWDIILGVLLVVLGLFMLGETVLTTAVYVRLLGWLAVAAGAAGLVAAWLSLGQGHFWSNALSGGLLLVLGIAIVRNPAAGAFTLTLVAGTVFLVSGITRLVAASQNDAYRLPLLFSGVASTVLGVLVLFNIVEATLTLLGVLLGVQALIDGITLILVGRVHLTPARS